jgi:hypothetical protein
LAIWWVISVNVALALISLGLTRKVWCWRHQLLQWNRRLTLWEQEFQQDFVRTTQRLRDHHTDLARWQQQYTDWQHRRLQLQYLLTVIKMAQRLIRRGKHRHRRL